MRCTSKGWVRISIERGDNLKLIILGFLLLLVGVSIMFIPGIPTIAGIVIAFIGAIVLFISLISKITKNRNS